MQLCLLRATRHFQLCNMWLGRKKKGRVLLLNAMEAKSRSRGTVPFTLDPGTRWKQVVNF